MIWALVWPEATERVIRALEHARIGGMTRIPVTNFDREPGISRDAVHYREISREMLMIAVPDNEVARAVMIIRAEAKIGSRNMAGEYLVDDGRIFVTYVEDSFAIRTFGRTGRDEKPYETDHCSSAR